MNNREQTIKRRHTHKLDISECENISKKPKFSDNRYQKFVFQFQSPHTAYIPMNRDFTQADTQFHKQGETMSLELPKKTIDTRF